MLESGNMRSNIFTNTPFFIFFYRYSNDTTGTPIVILLFRIRGEIDTLQISITFDDAAHIPHIFP